MLEVHDKYIAVQVTMLVMPNTADHRVFVRSAAKDVKLVLCAYIIVFFVRVTCVN